MTKAVDFFSLCIFEVRDQASRIDERYLQGRGIIFGSNMQVERSRKSKPHPCGLLCVDPLQKSRCVERIRASQFA